MTFTHRNLATALHAVVKGRSAPIDIVSVLQPPHGRRFAFLSITFGLIANLDIGTEQLRCLHDTGSECISWACGSHMLQGWAVQQPHRITAHPVSCSSKRQKI